MPPVRFVRMAEPDPVNVRSDEIAGAPRLDGIAGTVLNWMLGAVKEKMAPGGVPFTAEGAASTIVSTFPPPAVARTSNRRPQRGEAA